MVETWGGAIQRVYSEIEAADTGVPPADALRALHDAGDPKVLSIIALFSACRSAVYPQLPSEGVIVGEAAIAAMLARLAGATSGLMPEVDALIGRARGTATGGDPTADALRCLGEAVAYVVSPSTLGFVAVVQAMIASQSRDKRQPRAMQTQMAGWMDDVIGRAALFTLHDALTLAAQTLAGSLRSLPRPFYLEATGDDAGDLLVWVADPNTRRLLLPVLRVAEPRLLGRDLQVRVRAEPDRIRDRFRIGYLFEHYIHRMFLDGCWAMRCDTISYTCVATGDRWQVPA